MANLVQSADDEQLIYELKKDSRDWLLYIDGFSSDGSAPSTSRLHATWREASNHPDGLRADHTNREGCPPKVQPLWTRTNILRSWSSLLDVWRSTLGEKDCGKICQVSQNVWQTETTFLWQIYPSIVWLIESFHSLTWESIFWPILDNNRKTPREETRLYFHLSCYPSNAFGSDSDQMDTYSFFLAFRRFVSMRGTPKVVYSDNGSNLKAGEKELKEEWERLCSKELLEHLAEIQVTLIYSHPSAPHFGGAWERLVQSCKKALCVTLNDRATKEEVLRTAFAEAAAIFNASLLTHLSVNPRDLRPLTPNHFLLLRSHPHIPLDVFEVGASLPRWRWLAAQEIVEQFWKRWMKEYVPHLTESKKWNKKERNVAVGDLVLTLLDPNSAKGTWPIGRVIETIKAVDGLVWSVVVKTSIEEEM